MAVTAEIAKREMEAEIAAGWRLPVSELLAERKKTHGSYDADARCAMRLLDVLSTEEQRRDSSLTHIQRHALRMILHKVARIVAGDPNFRDHWDDIGGYAELAVRWCTVKPTVMFSPRFSSEVRTTSTQEKKSQPPNGADVLAAKEDHQSETPTKLPCYCNGGACMMEHGGRLKYVYCKKAENADKKVPRYSNETSNREPAEV